MHLVAFYYEHKCIFPLGINEWILNIYHTNVGGTRWRSWLRHCPTTTKVTGSIPKFVIGILHWHNPSSRSMILGSTQSLTEINTRNISWGVKADGAQGWQPYHLLVPIVLKYGFLKLLEPSGPVQACTGIETAQEIWRQDVWIIRNALVSLTLFWYRTFIHSTYIFTPLKIMRF